VQPCRYKYLEKHKDDTMGQGEVEITHANTDLVQRQLSNLAHHLIPVIQASTGANMILEEECDSQKNGILIMECSQQTEKV
jgi:hypothetical protein